MEEEKMAEQNKDDGGEKTKERWAFIEEAAKEVSGWSDWKKAEVSPNEINTRREEVKAASAPQSKIIFD